MGPIVHLQEKLFVPVKEYPDYNFVGRILGPRGLTAKQLEAETGCKIMVRGKSSMRDKKKEEQNRGKPNWEHLNEDLHVLITVEDSENRAKLKLERAVEEVKKLLTVSDGEDELKKRQLMELAIINGTYRDSSSKNSSPGLESQCTQQQRLQLQNSQSLQVALQQQALRQGGLGGAPLILSPRLQGLQVPSSLSNGLLNGAPPPLINPADAQGLLYAHYGLTDYSNYAGLTSPLLADYTADASGSQKDRRTTGYPQPRQHPYSR